MSRPGYWTLHARSPVRFEDGIRTLRRQGHDVFLEAGPKPVLSGMARRFVQEPSVRWLSSLSPAREDWQVMLDSLASLYTLGTPVDWKGFDQGYTRTRLHLPSYPFQRRRYWVNHDAGVAQIAPPARGKGTPLHPLLGSRLRLARQRDEVYFESQLGPAQPRLLDDHRVQGFAIMPAAGFVEMVLSAGAEALQAERMTLRDVVFHQPLSFKEDGARTVQTFLSRDDSGGHSFEIHSRVEGSHEPGWIAHVSGTLKVESGDVEGSREELAAVRERISRPLPVEEFYGSYGRLGIAFRTGLPRG